jgi:hypothetical protein
LSIPEDQKKQLIEKFKSELEQADWNALKAHHERGALFVVAGDLDLYEVACSIALDDVANVKSWIESEKLAQPGEEEVKTWEEDEYRKLGSFLILQPYVILQLGL